MTNVTADTTLITMGSPSRVEDLTLKLTSTGHHTLKGIVFGGTTTVDAKLRTSVLTVDNSGASSGGSSNVYGVECNGTGSLTPKSFSFNSVKGSTINVLSNGGGNKRGVLISNSNIVSFRDTNVYVAAPINTTSSTGSYVGIETNDSVNNLGSIQIRTSSIGSVKPSIGDSYSSADILQTTPSTITDPTYLASPGIQIGPGADLVTKNAGSKGFTTYVYPTTIYYGIIGNLSSGTPGWLWPGTQSVSSGIFPDPSGIIGNIDLNVSSTSNSNRVNVSSTLGLAVNIPVVFNTNIGNIVAGTIYYVYDIGTGFFRISTAVNGTLFTTGNEVLSITGIGYSTLIVTASSVDSSNRIILDTTSKIIVGMPIIFSEILGNLVPGTPYYVDTIGLIGGITPYITVSITNGGSIFTTGVASNTSHASIKTISTEVSSVSGTTITVNHSDGLIVGMPIVFASNIGNIVQGTIYYVQASGGNGANTLSIATTINGTAFSVGTSTGTVTANLFNMKSAPAFYRVQQSSILSGINTSLSLPVNSIGGSSVTLQVAVYRTPSGMNSQTSISPVTDFFVTFNDSTTLSQSYYNSSKTFYAGDKLHIYLSFYGGTTTAHDLSIQVDMF